MIKEIWFTPEFQRRSKSARNNWLTKTNGKLSTHSRGMVSFALYRVSMVKIVYIFYNGLQIFIFILSNIVCLLIARKSRWKEPLWDDVFSVLHQSAKKPETFVDNKSKKVVVSTFLCNLIII
jgi:hypothetical protein